MQKFKDPLTKLRSQLIKLIEQDYKTVEEFCWDKDLNKATISNFLRGKKDFRVSTLVKIAAAVGGELVIKIE